jgi:hypothetical protein
MFTFHGYCMEETTWTKCVTPWTHKKGDQVIRNLYSMYSIFVIHFFNSYILLFLKLGYIHCTGWFTVTIPNKFML